MLKPHGSEANAMIQAIPEHISFDEFIQWYPDNSDRHYELHHGVIIEMPKPKGKHSLLAGDLAFILGTASRQATAESVISKECIVKAVDEESGYEPDVIVLDQPSLKNEPRWESSSVITLGKSVRLIAEVVSSNWRDDYFTKFGAYEALGIFEYWIVDYAAIGGRRFLGNPKQPTLTICTLVEGEYELNQFRGSDRILSSTFPELELTAEQVLQVRA